MIECPRIAIAQLNPTMGDLAGNLALVRKAHAEAAARNADLVVATELVMTGYPPEDLVLKRAFQDDVAEAVRDLASDTGDGGPAIIVGAPWRIAGRLHNTALLLANGNIVAEANKFDLPNYGVFDEKRVFAPGSTSAPIEWRGHKLGVMVCEDMWTPIPAKALASAGARQLIVINGSPYEHDKSGERLALARARARETGLPLIYANQVGGQDEVVFDGASFVVNADGAIATRLSSWREEGRRHRMGNRGIGRMDLYRGRRSRPGRRARRRVPGDGHGSPGLRAEEPVPRRGPGPFRRDRFGAVGGGGRRCPGRGTGALRDDAVRLHLARESR